MAAGAVAPRGYIDGGGGPDSRGGHNRRKGAPAAPAAPHRLRLAVDDWRRQRRRHVRCHGNRIYSSTGRWYQKICDGRVEVNGRFVIPERRRSIPDLAQRARHSVVIPVPPLATSPPADRRLYTRVPTWFWVDPAWWRGYSATAYAGAVSSTVSPGRCGLFGRWATVVRRLRGPGTAWRPGMADDQSTCSYTYKNSSAGQRGDVRHVRRGGVRGVVDLEHRPGRQPGRDHEVGFAGGPSGRDPGGRDRVARRRHGHDA